MVDKISKKLGLLLVSLFISGILCLLIAEVVFFITHGAWYRKKSYLLYRSMIVKGELAKLAEDLYYSKDKWNAFPKEYKPIILKNIPGEFNASLLQKMRIVYSDISRRDDYDLVVSFWARCAKPERVKLFLLSKGTLKNSLLVDTKVEENGYHLFLASIAFTGDVEGWVENAQEITNCKDLKIFLKIHPFVYRYKKSDGAYRIIVIGGSTSASYGITPWQTYSFFLQKYFDALFPGRVDVINLALPGSQLYDFLENQEYYISLKPDMIIIAPVWNDIHSATTEKFLLNKKFLGKITYYDILKHIRENRFFSTYALGYYLYKLFNIKLTKEESLLNERLTKLDPRVRTGSDIDTIKSSKNKYWDVIERRLDSLVRIFQKEGIRVTLVTLPSLSNGTEPSPEEKKNLIQELPSAGIPEVFFNELKLLNYFELIDKEILQEVAQKRGTVLVICQDDSIFRDSPYSVRKDFFWDHAHFTPQGSELIGTIITGKIYKIVKESLEQTR